MWNLWKPKLLRFCRFSRINGNHDFSDLCELSDFYENKNFSDSTDFQNQQQSRIFRFVRRLWILWKITLLKFYRPSRTNGNYEFSDLCEVSDCYENQTSLILQIFTNQQQSRLLRFVWLMWILWKQKLLRFCRFSRINGNYDFSDLCELSDFYEKSNFSDSTDFQKSRAITNFQICIVFVNSLRTETSQIL